MKFKVTYQKVVTRVHVEGEWEVEVEAGNKEQAKRVTRTGVAEGYDSTLTTTLGEPRKISDVLDSDTSETKLVILTVDRT